MRLVLTFTEIEVVRITLEGDRSGIIPSPILQIILIEGAMESLNTGSITTGKSLFRSSFSAATVSTPNMDQKFDTTSLTAVPSQIPGSLRDMVPLIVISTLSM